MRSERTFLLPWLCSAAVVALIRFLHAADLGYDTTLQIQAGQNLLSGNGLAIYWPISDDLADPLTLVILTHFSAGYSLYAAALMALGLDAAALVKISGTVATIVGWWGWAYLASIYMSEGSGRSRVMRFTGYWVAVVTPLLFTSRWAGTDIILWAAVPWVLRLVTRASDLRAQTNVKLDMLAGLLAGLCVLSRYAGMFLAGYAFLVLAGQSWFRPRVAVHRLVAFGAGLLPALAIQGYVNLFLAGEGTAPGGIVLNIDRASTAALRAWESVTSLGAANQGMFFWLPATLRFWPNVAYQPAALVLAGAVLIGLPLTLGVRRQPLFAWFHDLRIVAAGMLVALPLFLWTCGLVGSYAYINDLRYYEPIRPLAVCIAYFLATREAVGGPRSAAVTGMSRAYLFAFVVMTAVEVAAVIVPTSHGAVWRRAVLGAEPRPWPSFHLTYEFSPARRFVLDLMKVNPGAILLTTREQWFYAEPEIDRSRVRRLEVCETLRATHISGPARFLLFEQDLGAPSEPVRWPDQLRANRDCWPELPGVHLLRRFPDERLRVLQVDIPEGVVIPIKNPRPSGE